MYEDAVGHACEGPVGEVDIDYTADDCEPDGEVPENGKHVTRFHFFQKALSYELAQLDEAKLEEYVVLAETWNAEGPTEEEKKR